MNGLARRGVAADSTHDLWKQAVELRQEWRDIGLSTSPADRPAAERLIAGIYARHFRRRPEFVWVDSPAEALPLLRGMPTHADLQQWLRPRTPDGVPPLVTDIAAGLSRMRSGLDAHAVHPDLDPPVKPRKGKKPEKQPPVPPVAALEAGAGLRRVLNDGVREALWTGLVHGFVLPVRAAMSARSGVPVPVGWFGQQDAFWVAYYDILRQLGLAAFAPGDEAQLDEWAALVRAAGWWWPDEHRCVLVERPATVHMRLRPGGWHEEVRLDRSVRAPVVYRDGWAPSLPGREQRPWSTWPAPMSSQR